MTPDYTAFGTVDFAVDDQFLAHYFKPDETSGRFWDAWLAQHPEKGQQWQEARRLVEAVALGLSDYARTYLSEEAEAELLARILLTNQKNDEQRIFQSRSLTRMAMAAAVTLLLVSGGYWLLKVYSQQHGFSQTQATNGSMIERLNEGKTVKTIILPDSSKVALSPGSRISYPKDYGTINRPTWLSGRAVFDVTHNPGKPFLVYAAEVVTKVLGTKFEVNAFAHDRDVTVSVISGKVSVYERPDGNAASATHSGVLLVPNQQVVFVRQTGQFNKALVSNPAILPAAKNQFVYEEQHIAQVLDDLAAAYGVDIVYSKEMLEHCNLTADLTRETLQEKLDVICRSINASYEIVEAQVIINSNGCKINETR